MSRKKKKFSADFLGYHKSLASELDAVKDRIKHLSPHRGTQGAFKEAALRTVLRRHLPESLFVGSGFIVNQRSECSTQIDLLIVDRDHPTLFKDGDLLIVTPSAVRGIIEVKTSISGKKKIRETSEAVLLNKLLCREWPSFQEIFTGVYVYEAKKGQSLNIVGAAHHLYRERKGILDCFCYGRDLVSTPQPYRANDGSVLGGGCTIWNTPNLASAYFCTAAISTLARFETMVNSTAWSPRQAENKVVAYMDLEEGKPMLAKGVTLKDV